jgi:hypothetical protein
MLNKDFKEFVEFLNASGVEYLVVGGYALAAHDHPRATGDIDFWIGTAPANVAKLMGVLSTFGFASVGPQQSDFLGEDAAIQLGYPPARIDLMTSIGGASFNECFSRRQSVTLGGVSLSLIGLEDFRANKKVVGRLKDLADLEALDDPEQT